MSGQLIMVPAHAERTDVNQPRVTVLICTRNRGDSIMATIRSLLLSDYPSFDLLIVDQSSDSQTARAIGGLGPDPRLRYVHTSTNGVSNARNTGLAFSRSELVLMTDDDCEVPPNWIAEMVAPFLRYSRLGIVFSNVNAGPYDRQAGFIPVSMSPWAGLIEDLAHWRTCDGVNIGIGASMAIRRTAAEAIGGFDQRFGPGSHFRNGDDLDFTLRALTAGYQIFRINNVDVIHHGFRSLHENRALMRGAMYGAGAAYGRLLRRGQPLAILYYSSMFTAMVIVPIIEGALRRRVPRVLGRAIWLLRGLAEGLWTLR